MTSPFVPPAQLAILRLLAKRAMYGLEIANESDGAVQRGGVHVLLGRMQAKGIVRKLRDPEPEHSGMPRPRYALTAKGEQLLEITEAAYATACTVR